MTSSWLHRATQRATSASSSSSISSKWQPATPAQPRGAEGAWFRWLREHRRSDEKARPKTLRMPDSVGGRRQQGGARYCRLLLYEGYRAASSQGRIRRQELPGENSPGERPRVGYRTPDDTNQRT